MKSHYMRNKALHSCIEIAFLSSVNLYDTVRQLSSLWQLCLAFMLLLLLLHATCHMSHGAYSSGIVCLIASFRSVLFSCTTRLLTNVQFIYAADSRQTLKDDSLPRSHLPPPPSICVARLEIQYFDSLYNFKLKFLLYYSSCKLFPSWVGKGETWGVGRV